MIIENSSRSFHPVFVWQLRGILGNLFWLKVTRLNKHLLKLEQFKSDELVLIKPLVLVGGLLDLEVLLSH